jgi:hypothetical protein
MDALRVRSALSLSKMEVVKWFFECGGQRVLQARAVGVLQEVFGEEAKYQMR